jgi:stage V sporulation protein B
MEAGYFPTSRGAVLLITSQAIGLMAGFITQVSLTRLLMPEAFGLYAVTLSVLSWLELLVMSGVTVPFTKAVSEGRTPTSVLWGWVWRGYLPFWVTVWLLFSGVAGWIAALLRDERLFPLLLVAGAELPFVGIQTASQSLLMGLRAYGWTAVLAGLQPLLRMMGILTFAFATRSVLWVLVGNTLAMVGAAAVGMAVVRPFLSRSEAPSDLVSPLALLAGFGVPLTAITLLDQIILVLDLWLLKRVAAPQVAGFYGASRLCALALFMLAVGLGQAWFPAMCQALSRGEGEKAKGLLREALRVVIIGFTPIVAIVWATARPLAVLLFSPSFEPAAEPMRWLVIAMTLMVLTGFLRGALIADNAVKSPLLLTVFMALSDFALCAWLIPQGGMKGAALATTLTSLLGCGMAVILTIRRFGNVVPMGTVVRCGIASLVIGGIASVWSAQGAALVGQYLLLSCLYGGLLIAFKELKAQDGHILRVVVADIFASVAAMLGRSEKSK